MYTPKQKQMNLKTIEGIFRQHSIGNEQVSLGAWLTFSTLSRYRDWVPRPNDGETTLMDVGCYQPSIGYYHELGWKRVLGIAKEEGEMASSLAYTTDDGARADILILDVEREKIPLADSSVDAVIMMETFEHFGIDPMHALIEVNRVLKTNGRLVFSTPNAAEYSNLYRILCGYSPFEDLEFTGFSGNRHNRLYDCYELSEVLRDAGFAIDLCTSRSYRSEKRRKWMLFRWIVKIFDRFRTLVSSDKRLPERDQFVFIVGRKEGLPRERYPQNLYFSKAITNLWPGWFQTIKREQSRS